MFLSSTLECYICLLVRSLLRVGTVICLHTNMCVPVRVCPVGHELNWFYCVI